ncbi:MAG: prepilin-type N-terminal cleavage/methylation domain-containing protein [Ruminococcus sp.]|nr:prepilin-type N-terminal cleavage/methylation domain-containing protein [Ruminococcus sp.]
MKTTKKGFTLIELIVVIAIIGVLAAILVPSMLGYVRKSKVSSANSTASSIYKAINSALTELDEEGVDIGGNIKFTKAAGVNSTNWTVAAGADAAAFSGSVSSRFNNKVMNFFSDLKKVKGECVAYSRDGSCVAVGVALDSTYCGTYPGGIVTTDTYKDFKGSAAKAASIALSSVGTN